VGDQISARHRHVQRLRRLVRRRSVRDAERAFVAEGSKVIAEALAAGVVLESLYLAPGADDPLVEQARAAGARVRELAPGVLEKVTDAVNPQPLLAVAPYVDVSLNEIADPQRVMVLVDVRDPGNAGTVLRTAEAAGIDGVVFCNGSVDIFNPKCVRASAGSLFHVPVVRGGDALAVVTALQARGLRCLGTVADGGEPYDQVDWRSPVAVVLGNEAHGLPEGLSDVLDGFVTIPMEGRSESLNVGMAAAVLAFEMSRQRRAA
jgi:TrmH family RNA methyltransferase